MSGGRISRSDSMAAQAPRDLQQEHADAHDISRGTERFQNFYQELGALKTGSRDYVRQYNVLAQGNPFVDQDTGYGDLLETTGTADSQELATLTGTLERDVGARMGHKTQRLNEKLSAQTSSRADRHVASSVVKQPLLWSGDDIPGGVFRRIKNLLRSPAKLARQIQSYRRESQSLMKLYDRAGDVKADAAAARQAYNAYAKLRDVGPSATMRGDDFSKRLAQARDHARDKLNVLKASKRQFDSQITARRQEVSQTRSRFRWNPMQHVERFERNSQRLSDAIGKLDQRLKQDAQFL